MNNLNCAKVNPVTVTNNASSGGGLKDEFTIEYSPVKAIVTRKKWSRNSTPMMDQFILRQDIATEHSGLVRIRSSDYLIERQPETQHEKRHYAIIKAQFSLQYKYRARAETFGQVCDLCWQYGTYSNILFKYDSKRFALKSASLNAKRIQEFLLRPSLDEDKDNNEDNADVYYEDDEEIIQELQMVVYMPWNKTGLETIQDIFGILQYVL